MFYLKKKCLKNKYKTHDTKTHSLTTVPTGVPVIIKKIPELNGYQAKLFEMGLFPGIMVEVIKGRKKGIYLLRINNNKILLPENIVENIKIRYL